MAQPPSRRAPLAVLAAVSAVGAAGCAAVPPVVFASAGLSVAQIGAANYVNGELQTALPVPMDRTLAAVTETFEDLDIPVADQRVWPEETLTRADLADTRRMTVRLRTLSPTVTKIRIRVGVWGDQAVSRLILGHLEERLRPYLDTPSEEPAAAASPPDAPVK